MSKLLFFAIIACSLSACERSGVQEACAGLTSQDQCTSYDKCEWVAATANTGVCKAKEGQ
jgi:hypothetical protein